MAACLEDLLKSVCSICFERYNVPRKLPSCKHSFCEACILKYSTTLVENKEDGAPTELPCPLCREVNHVPTDNADVGQWVTSLELNEELVKSVETESQTDTPELCVRCKESSRPVAASKYCFDCQEHLCERCCQTGYGFKLLRNHSIIDITPEDIDKKQRQLIESISVYTLCKRHPEKKLRFICVEEDKLCCDICKDMIHNTCRGIIEIKEYVTKNNITEEVPKLKDILSSLSDLSKLLIQRKNENEASNKTDTQTILDYLQTMRQNMNQVLDALEDNVREQCKAVTKKCALADQEDISKLQELVKTFDISSKMLDNALKQAPLDLTFIILHEMQSSNEYQETTILEFQHNFKRFGLKIASLDELLQKIQALSPNSATKMIKINVKKSDINLPKYANRQLARYSKVTKLGMKCFFEAPELSISGMAVASDNKMFFVDNSYQTYHLIDTTYKILQWDFITAVEDRVSKSMPHDVCTMKNNYAAISVPKEKKLYFISCQPKERGITGEVRTKYEPVALFALSNGEIAVSWDNPVAFGILKFHQSFAFDEKVYFDRDQTGRILKSFQYMGVDKDRSHVIQPCSIDKAVFCFDFDGVPKFTYKHPALTRPMGVTIDPDGAIYVCDREHNSIHILSPSGEPARIMIKGVPSQPVNVLYKRRSNELVVATDTKPYAGVCVFKIEI